MRSKKGLIALLTVAGFVSLAAPAPAQIVFSRLSEDAVRGRLQQFAGTDAEREEKLKSLFVQAGCAATALSEQEVKHEKLPNLVCVLPGQSDETIIVGAHYDHISAGDGVVDNWSGASLLPSLFESLRSSPRRHTFVFVAFTSEEEGLIGSKAFAKDMADQQRERTEAMVNMDTLGLGPSEVWVGGHADNSLVHEIGKVASGMKLPVGGLVMHNAGDTDSTPFQAKNIPVVTITSVTLKTLSILHTKQDRISAIHFDDYYRTYELVAGYLAALDHDLQPRAGVLAGGHE